MSFQIPNMARTATRKETKSTSKSTSSFAGFSFKWVAAALVALAAALAYLALSGGTSSPSSRQATIVMVGHNENAYLVRTFDSIMANTPAGELAEIIFVDDESHPPASDVLDTMNNPLIRIIRNEERQGLIRAKTQGARAAKGEVIIYLDAHIRAYPGWFEPLMKHTGENYKRVVVPLIPVLDGNTWEQIKNYVGIKLLFDWKMDFIWLPDEQPIDDWVPIMSGGLLAITRRWFFESGAYDEGMLMWGGENVEQSVRTWLCGGEIVVARDSRVGHMFRDESPYVINTTQIHVNKARAIDVWFDDWKEYYYRANPFDKERRASPESLAPRFALKEQLGCKPFGFFVEKFKHLFLRHDLLFASVFAFKHDQTGLCVQLREDGVVVGADCDPNDESQVFIPEEFKRFRFGSAPNNCLQASHDHNGLVTAAQCSAHIGEQLNWIFDKEKRVLAKSPRDGHQGPTSCLTLTAAGEPAVLTGCSTPSTFTQVNTKPYSHEDYKG